jgi:hypothetical protein
MMCSRSFGSPVTDLPELVEVVSQFATRVARKARQQQRRAGAVHVFITTSPFRRNDRQHSAERHLPLVRPSADTRVIVARPCARCAAAVPAGLQLRQGRRDAGGPAAAGQMQARTGPVRPDRADTPDAAAPGAVAA